MPDQITELIDTMQRLERLLVRFELDMAARVHVVDYRAIEQLCDTFHTQMAELMRTSAETFGERTASTATVSHAGSRGAGRISHE